jgi:hypothetical protein
MMLKVTLNFSFCCVIVSVFSCTQAGKEDTGLASQHFKDSVSEARIDSAYQAIKSRCDTLVVHQVPAMVDSLLKDTALLQHFFDTGKTFVDADKKVEKVVRQLQADCDSNLLKETYRKALLRPKIKPLRHKKQKI